MCMPGLEISIGIMNELLTLCSESMDRYKSITEAFEKNEGLEEEDKEVWNYNYNITSGLTGGYCCCCCCCQGIEEQLEEEEDLLRNLVDALGELIKLHRADIIPAFDAKVMNVFARVLQVIYTSSLSILVSSSTANLLKRLHDVNNRVTLLKICAALQFACWMTSSNMEHRQVPSMCPSSSRCSCDSLLFLTRCCVKPLSMVLLNA